MGGMKQESSIVNNIDHINRMVGNNPNFYQN